MTVIEMIPQIQAVGKKLIAKFSQNINLKAQGVKSMK